MSGSTGSASPVVAQRRRLLAAPVALGAAAVSGLVVLLLVDTSATRITPPCPFLALTGLWCPFCGGTRALDALVAGDVVPALGMNVVAVVAVPVLLAEYVRWTLGRARGRPTSLMVVSTRVLAVVTAAVLAYALLRNLPGFEVLTPAYW